MAADEEPPRYLLREPLIPLGVATALPALLIKIREFWGEQEQRGPGAARPLDSWDRANAAIATKLALADLDHCISAATGCGQQVPAARWESLLEDLQSLKRELDARR